MTDEIKKDDGEIEIDVEKDGKKIRAVGMKQWLLLALVGMVCLTAVLIFTRIGCSSKWVQCSSEPKAAEEEGKK